MFPRSSIELVQNVINRSRTDLMARLDEGEREGNIIGDTLRIPRSRFHSVNFGVETAISPRQGNWVKRRYRPRIRYNFTAITLRIPEGTSHLQ
ncbi:hypothetical protein M378DRAFT_174420 [Amanita muscaria Koide BX008]|uniref:Uncharacterized protein n=1 Tax=Amanita muscaria (strain Koide BX008) TaxID=946122 RepID=A0A0C2SJS2_AMAMK|nr:hypothetical protein M378DRAFT_174420 [Amanita muscaria Koide BX008]